MTENMALRIYSILIVTKNAIYREGLARILPQERFRIILKIASVDVLRSNQSDDLQPDLVIFGITSGSINNVDNIVSLNLLWPSSRIVVLSERHNQCEIAAAFNAGISAWIEHPSSNDALVNIIDLVLSGETILISSQLNQLLAPNAAEAQTLVPGKQFHSNDSLMKLNHSISEEEPSIYAQLKPHVPALSVREKMIAAMLVSGYPNKVIARSIDVSEATVKVHIKSILRKIRVTNRTQAAIWATKNGFVGPEDHAQFSTSDDLNRAGFSGGSNS